MNRSKLQATLLLLATFAIGQIASAADWPSWRGPNFDGSSNATNLPTDFSKTKHVKWTADMGGPAASSPIVVGDRIFLTKADEATSTLHGVCLSRQTGEVLWSKQIAQGYALDNKSNLASPSPVADDKGVAFYFGTGDLAVFTNNGKRVWQRNIQEDFGAFAYQWTYSASPTLFNDTLYIPVLQRDVPVHDIGGTGDGKPIESYLLAIDARTGETKWQHVRPSDAEAESLEAFGTVMPYTFEGKTQLLIAGGDCLTSHDPNTGRELWRWGTWNKSRIGHWRLVPSAVAGNGVVLACGPKKEPVFAVRMGAKGFLPKSDVIWQSKDRDITTDVCTPLFYNGKFYILRGEAPNNISRIDPKTGDIEFLTSLRDNKTKIRTSPTGADGKVFFMNHAGQVMIVDADSGKLINTIEMGEKGDDNTRSTIAAVDSELFIRTNSTLYCISK